MQQSKRYIEEIKDPLPPFALFRAIYNRPYSFFLDSSLVSEKLGRFSYIGSDPFLVFIAKGDVVTLIYADGRREEKYGEPLAILKKILRKYKIKPISRDGIFSGGAVGYFSYDLKDRIEDIPDKASDDLHLPDICLGFYDSVIIYDHCKNRCWLSHLGISEFSDRYIRSALGATHTDCKENFGKVKAHKIKSNFSKRQYIAMVDKAKEYIKRGDIYQVNLSQRFMSKLNISPIDLYERLRKLSPAPFSSYLHFGDTTILSSSPERFLFKRGNYIETRPIKGTRPRGSTSGRDLKLAFELLKSAKDCAEHIMIVDLERNDLGRVSRYGSVRVSESMKIEKYSNVFHMVSTVCGKLKRGVDAVDCIAATFPGGSITGAPKVKAMEIIDELESVKRGIYTGAIGYIGFNGTMDTSITIRTFVIKDKKVYFQVGGGIVADSDPEEEYNETLDKARGLMQALGINGQ